MFLLGAPLASAQSFAEADRTARVFRIGNSTFERILRLDRDGIFGTSDFHDLARGPEWAGNLAESGEFRVVVKRRRGPPAALTGASGWRFHDESHEVAADGTASLVIRLDSTELPVRVALHYECFPEAPAVRTFLEVSNRGLEPFTLLGVDSVFLRVGSNGDPMRLLWVGNFTWGNLDRSLQPSDEALVPGSTVQLTTGASGTAAAWFALRSAQADAGLFGGWEWSGTGEMRFAAEPGSVAVSVGLGAPSFAHTLAPQETFTTPASFVGLFRGSWDAASEKTRALVEARYAPPLPSASFPPAAFDTWGYQTELDDESVHGLVDTVADLGVEHFTLDAGWMFRIGDWEESPGAFQGGIAAISGHAHARGMTFGLWVAFGCAHPDSAVALEHPEWIARRGGEPIAGEFDTFALCLADPHAREWVLSELDRIVVGYGVDWLVHDFTVITDCDDPGHGHQPGDGNWASTKGYYAILDELRRRHPGLVVENCWNGGATLDFGMVRRHDTSSLNDRCDSKGNRQSIAGTSYFLPPRYLDKYVADDGTPDGYRFLSGLLGGPMMLMGRPTDWSDDTSEAARRAVALFKTHRRLLRDGRLYHLSSSPSAEGWDALMCFDDVERDGLLLAVRDGGSRRMKLGVPDLGGRGSYKGIATSIFRQRIWDAPHATPFHMGAVDLWFEATQSGALIYFTRPAD